jgi:hypothetical protein
MKHIKKYKLFLEEAEFEVNLGDEPDVKMSKEKLSSLKKQIADFKTKKTLLDKAFLTAATDADLTKAVENIVGKTDILPEEDRNPFIVEYLHISNLKRKIDNLQKTITNDKVKKDDFLQQAANIKDLKDDVTKQNVNAKINDITNRISTNYKTISSLTTEISSYQTKLYKKMADIEKDLKDNIKKISSESGK